MGKSQQGVKRPSDRQDKKPVVKDGMIRLRVWGVDLCFSTDFFTDYETVELLTRVQKSDDRAMFYFVDLFDKIGGSEEKVKQIKRAVRRRCGSLQVGDMSAFLRELFEQVERIAPNV